MKERPILMSGPMVRAILAGTKTQTRRAVKLKRADGAEILYATWQGGADYITPSSGHVKTEGRARFILKPEYEYYASCPYGVPGDRLWVRETFADTPSLLFATPRYRADFHPEFETNEWDWRPSIFMPRRFSRITLEITDVRVERVQDISQADACAEGTPPIKGLAERDAYQVLWESINGPGSWAANPWVWVIEFKKI